MSKKSTTLNIRLGQTLVVDKKSIREKLLNGKKIFHEKENQHILFGTGCSILNLIGEIKDFSIAANIVVLCKDNEEELKEGMQALLKFYSPRLTTGSKVLKEAFSIKSNRSTVTFQVGDKSYPIKIPDHITSNPDNKIQTFAQLRAQLMVLELFDKKGWKKDFLTETICKALENADQTLSLLKGLRVEKGLGIKSYYDQALGFLYFMNLHLLPDCRDTVFSALKHYWVQNLEILSGISAIYNDSSQHKQTILLLNPVLTGLEINDIDVTPFAYCSYNLGQALFYEDFIEEALTHYLAAFETLKNDTEVIMSIVDAYSTLTYLDKLNKFIESLPASDIKTLCELLANFDNVTINKVQQLNKQNIPSIYHLHIVALNLVADYNAQILKCNQIDKDHFTKRLINLDKKGMESSTIINIAIKCEFYDFIKYKLPWLSEKQIKTHPYLMHIKCLIDSSDQNLAKMINAYEIANTKKIELHAQAASSLLANESKSETNIEYAKMAMVHANEGLKLDPQNQDLLEIAYDAAFLSGEKEQMQEFKQALKKVELEQNPEGSSDSESSDKSSEEFDLAEHIKYQKKIHQKNQIRKAQALAKVQTSGWNMQKETGWKIDDKEVDLSQVKFIGKYHKLDCWGYIPAKIQSKISDNLEEFNTALSNGFTTKQQKQNGVKILKHHKAGEIKINGDLRLFTDEIYVNKEGKLLMSFDHFGGHNDINGFAKDHELHYIYLTGEL